MEKIVKASDLDIPLHLHQATVIHSDKYSEAYGGAFNFPVFSNLYTEVVFRLDSSGEDWPVYIKNLNLPVYNGQAVTLVSSGKTVLVFIDMQTNYYYYTTKNFAGKLHLGMPYFWVWIIGIMGGILLFMFQGQTFSAWLFVPVITAWIIYIIQKWILNLQIKKKIDSFLT